VGVLFPTTPNYTRTTSPLGKDSVFVLIEQLPELRFIGAKGRIFFHQILQLYKLNVGYFSINEYPIKNFPTSEKIFQAV
jgi:hypothetical protein